MILAVRWFERTFLIFVNYGRIEGSQPKAHGWPGVLG